MINKCNFNLFLKGIGGATTAIGSVGTILLSANAQTQLVVSTFGNPNYWGATLINPGNETVVVDIMYAEIDVYVGDYNVSMFIEGMAQCVVFKL